MAEEKAEEKEPKKVRFAGFRKMLRKIRAGKFFPRQFFIDHWSILLTVVVLFMAAIAHRNMYMIQLNKISKLEIELLNRRADRILLEYEYTNMTRSNAVEKSVLRNKIPLQPIPEPNEKVVLKK